MSIPYYFTREERDGNAIYDGGLTHNFPDTVFREQNPGATYIGLFLAPEEGRSATRRPVWAEVLDIMIGRDEVSRAQKDPHCVVWIDPSPIRTVDFDLSQRDKNYLLTCGRVGALRFLKDNGAKIDERRLEVLEDRRRQLRDKVVALRRRRTWLRTAFTLTILIICLLGWLSRGRVANALRTFAEPSYLATPGIAGAVSDVLSEPGKQDFFRIVLKEKGKSLSGRLGRDGAVRAFVSPARYFARGVSIGAAAALLGNRYDAAQDVVIMFCKANSDPRLFDARLATWLNLADAITTDLKEPADCATPASGDERLYCRALEVRSAGQAPSGKWVAGALKRLYSAVGTLLDDQTAAEQLRERYGVTESFSGLGFSVGGTGGPASIVRPEEVLSELTVPEYIVSNVSLEDAGCKCIRVAPYAKRGNDPLDLDWVESHGSAECPLVERLGGRS